MKVEDLKSIAIKLASPEEILSWSHGEVKRPETINYRTQRPEKDGLFCERIFGPTKDYECYCGKYKGIKYKGVVCDRCGVEVTKSSVRRERMGHITLATPVSHIWFLKGAFSSIGLLLGKSIQKVEKVVYFSAYIITKVDEEAKKKLLSDLNEEFQAKVKELGKQKIELKERRKREKELKDLLARRKSEILEIKPLKILSEIEYRNYNLKYGEIFEAGTGAETLRKIFEKMNLKEKIKEVKKKVEKNTGESKRKLLQKLKFIESMEKAKVRPEWMFLTVLPVLPPDLRPMVQLDGGRYASSDLNDLYRRVINRNNRLKYLLEISAPDVIVRNEKRMLQEAVDALLDNKMRKGQTVNATTGGKRLLKSLADILAGKQGRFRKNLLGKRVDYSARSVIVPGPALKLDQCGIPKTMALEIFRPFVIKEILDKELAYNIRGATRLIEDKVDEVWAILEDVVKDKLVLLNRAPTLHRLGIQAFHPVLIEGESIRLHPLVCTAYNADFDGDQMAVFLPLSDQAQKEAKDLMLSSRNFLKPANGLPIVTPTQDIILGSYYLTGLDELEKDKKMRVFKDFDEVMMAYQLEEIRIREPIKVAYEDKKGSKKLLETTCGRILFNQALPENYEFINKQIDKKELAKIVSKVVEEYSEQEIQQTLDKIKNLGFEYATLSGMSWGMDDLVIPKEKSEIVEKADEEVDEVESYYKKGIISYEERTEKIIEIWSTAKSKIEKLVPQSLPKNGTVYSIITSGTRGSWGQPVQMAGMKGLVTSPTGRIIELPIKHSFKEGFDVLEYFISTHGARKGTADRALRTSASGYLTRRLVDVAHEVIVMEDDCGDTEGIEVFREDAKQAGEDFIFKIVGRYCLEDIKGKDGKIIVHNDEIIDWEKARKIDEAGINKVRVRSPLSCKSTRGVCRKCYGWEMGRDKLVDLGQAVGIVAAQSIGEPGTQLTMRTFHLGGVSGAGDITQGLPRVEEIFEARTPKGESVLSLTDGEVKEVDNKRKIIKLKVTSKEKTKGKKEEIVEYRIPPKSLIRVKKGDKVKEGEPLSEGSFDLKKLFKLKGEDETKRYILREVQKIYASEGIKIHDKHIEVIIRQMFSRLKVVDPGDSNLVPGEIISRAALETLNKSLELSGKKKVKAKVILLGISKVALNSDSFLSAASFQETSRVLIKASLEGKEDGLYGLKENVIIGRLIPAGTGFRKKIE